MSSAPRDIVQDHLETDRMAVVGGAGDGPGATAADART
jgi:hypothetical protein